VPPFVGVAEKVTLAPEQIAPAGFAVIETVGATTGSTSMDMVFEFAVGVETQVALDVITTVTASPWFKVFEVKVEPVPEFVPFTVH